MMINTDLIVDGEHIFSPQSELGKTLWAIRQRAIGKGMKLQTIDDILEEIQDDRAGADEAKDRLGFQNRVGLMGNNDDSRQS
jgi:hypothetical protein